MAGNAKMTVGPSVTDHKTLLYLIPRCCYALIHFTGNIQDTTEDIKSIIGHTSIILKNHRPCNIFGGTAISRYHARGAPRKHQLFLQAARDLISFSKRKPLHDSLSHLYPEILRAVLDARKS